MRPVEKDATLWASKVEGGLGAQECSARESEGKGMDTLLQPLEGTPLDTLILA